MVRRRVEMKKIENKSSRQVAFSKRRKGLLKKARDLSVLCDADVAVIVFSHRGGLYDFCSAESFAGLLERYGEWIEAQNTKNTCEAENETSRVASIQKCVELLQILDRNLEEQRIDKMSVTELIQLEKQLDVARKETISRKTRLQLQSIEALCEKEMKLLEEKKMLRKEVAEITDKEGRGLEETSQKDCRLDPEGKLMTLNLFR